MSLSKIPGENLKQRLLLRSLKPVVFISIPLLIIALSIGIVFMILKPYLTLANIYGITPQFLWTLATSERIPLKQANNQINILVLGIAGENHEGSDLTDAMLIVHVNLVKPERNAFIALPRDIWSPTLKDKINTAYHYGEEKKKGGGLILTKSIVSEVTNLPIHYAVVVDFSKFIRLVDVVGGVDVSVDRTFDDYEFPIAGRQNDLCGGDPTYRCRYKHLHFDAGIQHMTGEQALEFVRSRHAGDEEGTDYARSNRQRAVLVALKKKAATRDVLFHSDKVRSLITLYDQATDTDLSIADLLFLAKFFKDQDLKDFQRVNISSEGKDRKPDDLLIVGAAREYNGRWVLVPRTKTFTEIQQFLLCQLEGSSCNQP